MSVTLVTNWRAHQLGNVMMMGIGQTQLLHVKVRTCELNHLESSKFIFLDITGCVQELTATIQENF